MYSLCDEKKIRDNSEKKEQSIPVRCLVLKSLENNFMGGTGVLEKRTRRGWEEEKCCGTYEQLES